MISDSVPPRNYPFKTITTIATSFYEVVYGSPCGRAEKVCLFILPCLALRKTGLVLKRTVVILSWVALKRTHTVIATSTTTATTTKTISPQTNAILNSYFSWTKHGHRSDGTLGTIKCNTQYLYILRRGAAEWLWTRVIWEKNTYHRITVFPAFIACCTFLSSELQRGYIWLKIVSEINMVKRTWLSSFLFKVTQVFKVIPCSHNFWGNSNIFQWQF